MLTTDDIKRQPTRGKLTILSTNPRNVGIDFQGTWDSEAFLKNLPAQWLKRRNIK